METFPKERQQSQQLLQHHFILPRSTGIGRGPTFYRGVWMSANAQDELKIVYNPFYLENRMFHVKAP